MEYNNRRLDYPSDASLKERFRSTVAMSQANGESDLHDLSWAVIREVYGNITESDFDSISAMAAFFADKRCIIREILDEAKRKRFTHHPQWTGWMRLGAERLNLERQEAADVIERLETRARVGA